MYSTPTWGWSSTVPSTTIEKSANDRQTLGKRRTKIPLAVCKSIRTINDNLLYICSVSAKNRNRTVYRRGQSRDVLYVLLCKASTDGEMNFFWSVYRGSKFSFQRFPIFLAPVIRRCFESGDACLVNLGNNNLKISHSSKNVRHLVTMVCACELRTELTVRFVISSFACLFTWSRYSAGLVNEALFVNVNVTPEYSREQSTDLISSASLLASWRRPLRISDKKERISIWLLIFSWVLRVETYPVRSPSETQLLWSYVIDEEM